MKVRAKRNNAFPAPGQRTPPIPNWNPATLKSQRQVTCVNCQHSELFWGWNHRTNKPQLIDKYGHRHDCPTPNTRDVFPGWCNKCKAPDLLWLRKKEGFELTESYGLPHTCEQEHNIQDISAAKCRHCSTPDLFWVKVNAKFTLTCIDGTKHTCSGFHCYMNDWAEAKRMNYAFEKAWLKSIPNGTECKKCKGKSYTTFLSKNKKTMYKFNSSEPMMMHRWCLHCKRIGTFTEISKKDHLKTLRKLYWPFKGGTHKWKKYDSNNGL